MASAAHAAAIRAARARVGSGGEWVVPKHLLDIHIDRGLVLSHLAERAIAMMDERTDRGLDVDGQAFTPYKTQTRVKGSAGGVDGIERDAKGRWILAEVRGPGDDVTLRSLHDVPDKKRMRANLKSSPRRPTADAKRVTIRHAGSRNGMTHRGRASWCAGRFALNQKTPSGRQYTARSPARKHVGMTRAEVSRLIAETKLAGILAWLRGKGQVAVRERVRAALAKQRRVTAARKAAARRAERSAAAAHGRLLRRMEQNGISAREAFSEQQRSARTRKRILKANRGLRKGKR